MYVDYRGFNKITKKNRHPLSFIRETLDRLQGTAVFTKLDVRDVYHRIRIRKGDEWKITFRTRYNHFEYTVMFFSLANALTTFQSYINRALVGLINIYYVIYLDNILIYSTNPADHQRYVREILERLRNFKLYLKLSKCEFSINRVKFLGFIVTTRDIDMEGNRVKVIIN